MEKQGDEKDNTISWGKQPGNGAALPSAEGQAAVFVIFAVLRQEGPASQSEPDTTPPAPGTQSPGAGGPHCLLCGRHDCPSIELQEARAHSRVALSRASGICPQPAWLCTGDTRQHHKPGGTLVTPAVWGEMKLVRRREHKRQRT